MISIGGFPTPLTIALARIGWVLADGSPSATIGDGSIEPRDYRGMFVAQRPQAMRYLREAVESLTW